MSSSRNTQKDSTRTYANYLGVIQPASKPFYDLPNKSFTDKIYETIRRGLTPLVRTLSNLEGIIWAFCRHEDANKAYRPPTLKV